MLNTADVQFDDSPQDTAPPPQKPLKMSDVTFEDEPAPKQAPIKMSDVQFEDVPSKPSAQTPAQQIASEPWRQQPLGTAGGQAGIQSSFDNPRKFLPREKPVAPRPTNSFDIRANLPRDKAAAPTTAQTIDALNNPVPGQEVSNITGHPIKSVAQQTQAARDYTANQIQRHRQSDIGGPVEKQRMQMLAALSPEDKLSTANQIAKQRPLTTEEQTALGISPRYASTLFSAGLREIDYAAAGAARLAQAPFGGSKPGESPSLLEQLQSGATRGAEEMQQQINREGPRGLGGELTEDVGALAPDIAGTVVLPESKIAQALYWGAMGGLKTAGRGGSATDIATSAVTNAALPSVLHGTAELPIVQRVLGSGGLMSTITLAQGGDLNAIGKSFILGGLMGIPGGKAGDDPLDPSTRSPDEVVAKAVNSPDLQKAAFDHYQNPTAENEAALRTAATAAGLKPAEIDTIANQAKPGSASVAKPETAPVAQESTTTPISSKPTEETNATENRIVGENAGRESVGTSQRTAPQGDGGQVRGEESPENRPRDLIQETAGEQVKQPEVGQVFDYRNQRYRVDSVDDQHIRATDLSGKEGMRVFQREGFDRVTTKPFDQRGLDQPESKAGQVVTHDNPNGKPIVAKTAAPPPLEVPELRRAFPIGTTDIGLTFSNEPHAISDDQIASLFPDYKVTVARQENAFHPDEQNLRVTFWDKETNRIVKAPADWTDRIGLLKPMFRGEEAQVNLNAKKALPAAEEGQATQPFRTADDAQKAIDAYEDNLEAQGIDPLSLWDKESVRQLGGEQNLPAGTALRPPELERLYAQRDALGAADLQRSIDGISTELRKAGIQEHDLPDVLKSIAIDPSKTDALAQNSAYEHIQKLALGDPKRLAEEIYIKLAAKRGLDVQFSRTSDDIIHPDKQTLADARNAVTGIRRYFEGGGKQEVAAPEEKPERYQPPSKVKEDLPIHQAVWRMGGIDPDTLTPQQVKAIRAAEQSAGLYGKNAILKRSGKSFDDMQQALGLGGTGHLNEYEALNDNSKDAFVDKIIDSIRGIDPHYSTERDPSFYDKELDKQYEQFAKDKATHPTIFDQEDAVAKTELDQPDSPLRRTAERVIRSGFDHEAIDAFRWAASQEYGFQPETIDSIISHLRRQSDDANAQNSVSQGDNGSASDPIAQFLHESESGTASNGTETARIKAEKDAELLRLGMQGGRANIEEQVKASVHDTRTPDMFDTQKDLFTGGSEAGAVRPELLNAVGVGIPKLVEKDVIPVGAKGIAAFRSAFDDIRKVFAPVGRSPEAGKTAGIIRANAGEMARKGDIAEAALKGAGKELMKLPEQERWDFVDRVEKGQKQPTPEMQATADVMRKLLDDRRAEVQALGTGKLQTFIEDYFPHIWEDPAKAKNAFAQFFGKRPMEGSKAFLKQRSIPTIADGLAAGLKPITDNPVDLLLLKAREIDRYVMAQKTIAEMKDSKIAQYVRAGDKPPDGFVALDDRVAKVYGGPDAKPQGGTLIRGQYYAPEAAARVFNNYLSPGLRGKPWFDAYLAGANVLNQAQLGLSAYHLGFTSVDAMVSKTALALQQLASGKFVEAGKSLLRTPIAPVENLIRGSKLLKEWQAPGTQSTEVQQLADAAMAAGGRAKMHSFYDARVTQNMVNAFKEGNILGGVLRAPFAAVEQAAKPIMQYIVPRQKMGIFADLAKHEMEKLPAGSSREDYRAAMARAWDSVDNRMGQMVYDNLFWDKTAKDLLMGSVRSVGWNLGTFRELGGGIADFGKQAVGLARGKRPEVTPRMAYTVALPFVVGALGAITQYLYTGKGPEELKDYYFPRTGNTDENGRPERVSLPSYMKDVYSYSQHPVRTVEHKLNPILSLTAEMLENKDYYNTKIRNEDDPYLKQVKDIALHVGTAAVPFGIRGMKKEYERSGKINPLPQIGIVPAPSDINQTAAEAKLHEIMQAKMPAGTRTSAEAEKAQMKSQLRKDARAGKDVSSQIGTAIQQGLLTPGEVLNIQKARTQTALQSEFKSLSIRDALKVWDAMTPDEKNKTRVELQMKSRLIMKEPVAERPALQQRLSTALANK